MSGTARGQLRLLSKLRLHRLGFASDGGVPQGPALHRLTARTAAPASTAWLTSFRDSAVIQRVVGRGASRITNAGASGRERDRRGHLELACPHSSSPQQYAWPPSRTLQVPLPEAPPAFTLIQSVDEPTCMGVALDPASPFPSWPEESFKGGIQVLRIRVERSDRVVARLALRQGRAARRCTRAAP